MENTYTNRLFHNEAYLVELDRIYQNLCETRRSRKRLEEIEKELIWFVGNEKTKYVPNYKDFYQYATEHYLSRKDKNVAKTKYKTAFEDTKSELPKFFLCLALLGKIRKEQKVFEETQIEKLEAKDKETIIQFTKLRNMVELLVRFFERHDSLVGIFIENMEMSKEEFLDERLNELNKKEVKQHFLTAIQKQNKSMTYKLINRMRELKVETDYYFEAVVNFIEENYEESLQWINQIERGQEDYVAGVFLKLECLAYLGESKAFIHCLQENIDIEYHGWQIVYLWMQLALRADLDEFNEIDDKTEEVINQVKYVNEENSYDLGKVYRLAANIIVEGLELITNMTDQERKAWDGEYESARLDRLTSLYTALGAFPADFKKYIDLDYIGENGLQVVKQKAGRELLEMLLENTNEKSFENVHLAFLSRLRLRDLGQFIKNLDANVETLIQFVNSGEISARELLVAGFIESVFQEKINEKLNQYVKKNILVNFEKHTTDEKILTILSENVQAAYEAAECLYRKTKEIDYGWKDAGILSIIYYRILEHELNTKIVNPILSSIGYENLNECYQNERSKREEQDAKEYQNKWEIILNTYQQIQESKEKNVEFMLGVLNYFFRVLGSEYDSKDPLAVMLKNELGKVLSTAGISKFKEGFFEQVTNDEARKKFSNPSANLKYMSYETASESRKTFRKIILQLGDFLVL